MNASVWVDFDRGPEDVGIDARVNPGGDNPPFIVVDIGCSITMYGRDVATFRELAQAMLRVADEFEDLLAGAAELDAENRAIDASIESAQRRRHNREKLNAPSKLEEVISDMETDVERGES